MRTLLLLLLHLLLAPLPARCEILTPPFTCGGTALNGPFCNTSLTAEKRAESLVALLTLEEKIGQLDDQAPALPRLGVPAYKWWSEALHGVSSGGRGVHFDDGGPVKAATSFPQVILSAATFDPELWHRIGQVIGTEARAIYNSGQSEGLTFWSPNINIFRDPRWGRGQETPGEDPTVVGKYAAAFVRGLQGDIEGPALKASACCKHFTAYDLDNWKGVTRYAFDAKVTPQDLEDTFQPPFKACVEEGRSSGIMCSYNRINGIPNCANYSLLTETARGRWGFHGYIVSDCDAVSIIHDVQGYARVPEDAVADVLKAGMDVNCGDYLKNYTASALRQGKITEADIDRALRNLFAVRIRLGLFDGDPRHGQFGAIGADQVCSAEHQALALEAACDGIVLLKNDAARLPLSKLAVSSLAVIGPNANNSLTLLGNYFGPPCMSITPFGGLQGYVADTRYAAGCDTVACPSPSVAAAVQLACAVEHVILVMGLDQTQETEALDRDDLTLPGKQQSLVTAVAAAAKRPVILVLLCGGPVDVSFAQGDPKIGAILWAGYPGEAGGVAIAQVIFGEHNPGGRLPMTWYPQEFTTVPMTDMRMRADPATGYPGRTYRFYRGKTVYPFGYGLSYSGYSHEFVRHTVRQRPIYVNLSSADVRPTVAQDRVTVSYNVADVKSSAGCEKLKFKAQVRVTNGGSVGGKHPVLLFMRWPALAGQGRPKRQLVGFKAVDLKAGESRRVAFEVKPCEHLAWVRDDGVKVIDEGSHWLIIDDDEVEVTVV